jgi:hypothetical protein
MRGPNFLGIGAQRAGTTWLYENLRTHPDIFLPKKKELRYFNFEYECGEEHYLENFADVGGESAIGEITPGYYWNHAALKRIAAYRPEMRLIFILRSPVDRAYSQYELYRDEFRNLSFSAALRERPELIDWGMYGRSMKWLWDLFPPQQILLLDYEDLSSDPKSFLRGVLEFLEVDSDFVPPSIGTRVNKVIYPSAQQFLNRLYLGWAIDLVKMTPLGDWLRARKAEKKYSMVARDREYIVARVREDVQLLERLTGREYQSWLRTN